VKNPSRTACLLALSMFSSPHLQTHLKTTIPTTLLHRCESPPPPNNLPPQSKGDRRKETKPYQTHISYGEMKPNQTNSTPFDIEEEGSGVRGRPREAGGGQDHGHRLTGEVPPGAHQGRPSRQICHRHPREEQDLRHLRQHLLQTVLEPYKIWLIFVRNVWNCISYRALQAVGDGS